MRVALVDPPAFTPPYDHALAAALAATGADVTLYTSRFAYGAVPVPEGYRRVELFYRHAIGRPGSGLRRAARLSEHVPGMLALRRRVATADVVHLQWLTVPLLDLPLLPRGCPLVLTAHDLLPREPRPGQLRAQRALLERVDAVIVHSAYGARQLTDGLGLARERVHVVHHGALAHALSAPRAPLPAELAADERRGEPVVLFVGLLRPYKGLDTLLEAWRGVRGGQLWIAGRPMMDLTPLRSAATPSVHWVPRYVSEGEIATLLDRADIVVLPYGRTERFDMSGVLAMALAFGKAIVLSDIGGFSEVTATGAGRLVPPDDPEALRGALDELVSDEAARRTLGAAARAAAEGPYSWAEAARRTLEVYRAVVGGPL